MEAETVGPTTGTNVSEEPTDLENSKILLAGTPLPLRSLFILNLLNACQPLAFELIFPFINQMILEIGVVDDPEKVGFYSGLIESIFAFMSLLAIIPCAYFSDRYGRKPVILFGITGLALSTSLFGMSRKFWFMVVTRCLGGALGGAWSAMKVMIAEMTDKFNQGAAFSAMVISYRLGQIVGQPLGGFLSHPEEHFSLFQSQFWYDYPFALPCFIAAAFAMVSVILGYVYLRETLGSKRKRTQQTDYGTMEAENLVSEEMPPRPSLRSVLTPNILALLLNSVGMILVSESMFALYPLFAFTPITSGGLGVSEATIGVHMTVRSTLHIAVMMLYGTSERRMGTLRLYRLSMITWLICLSFMPAISIIARNCEQSSILFNIVLFAFFTVWSFASSSWTGITVLLNDATPSAAALATVNGASQMAIALPQSIAPAFANSLFAYSI